MSEPVRVKICGLTRPEEVAAAVNAGAAYIGFVFFPKSPRHVSPALARELAQSVPPGVVKVALTVNADDAALDSVLEVVPIDMVQLHGAESPERVSQVKQRFGLPVMKALSVGTQDDLAAVDSYARVADQILLDAKPPKGAVLPGGNGVPFDWTLIAGRRWPLPWMLSGGLTPGTVAEAIACTGARQVDVSSGVESAPGQKDADLIAAFLARSVAPD